MPTRGHCFFRNNQSESGYLNNLHRSREINGYRDTTLGSRGHDEPITSVELKRMMFCIQLYVHMYMLDKDIFICRYIMTYYAYVNTCLKFANLQAKFKHGTLLTISKHK